jgi:hypothetical protein
MSKTYRRKPLSKVRENPALLFDPAADAARREAQREANARRETEAEKEWLWRQRESRISFADRWLSDGFED